MSYIFQNYYIVFIFSFFAYLFCMHFNLVTVRLWSDFQEVLNFEVWRLVEGSAYSSLSVNGRALIRGW